MMIIGIEILFSWQIKCSIIKSATLPVVHLDWSKLLNSLFCWRYRPHWFSAQQATAIFVPVCLEYKAFNSS